MPIDRSPGGSVVVSDRDGRAGADPSSGSTAVLWTKPVSPRKCPGSTTSYQSFRSPTTCSVVPALTVTRDRKSAVQTAVRSLFTRTSVSANADDAHDSTHQTTA